MTARDAQALNAVVIIIDDLRVTGSEVLTPNLDRLARRSMVFRQAYVQNPMCNPSRISFLSGLRSASTGVYYNSNPADLALPGWNWLPTCTRKAGWHTTLIGKVFHSPKTKDFIPKSTYDELVWFKPPGPNVAEVQTKTHPGLGLTRTMTRGGDLSLPDGRAATAAVERIKTWRSSRKPNAMFLGFHKPHVPFRAPERFFRMYDPSKIKLPAEPALAAQKYKKGTWHEDRRKPPSDAERREIIQGYYASVTYMDSQLGRVLDALDSIKAWKDTVVILFSDHGFHLGEHGNLAWSKAYLTEQTNQVPLMISVPKLPPGECKSLVELIDVYPTLLDLLGIRVVEPIEGRSLKPLLLDPGKAWKTAVFSEYRQTSSWGGYSIRTADYRYTRFKKPRLGEILIDHRIDPLESHNLARSPAHTKELAAIRALLPAGLALDQRVESLKSNPDRDGDGILDVAELRKGSNPRIRTARPALQK